MKKYLILLMISLCPIFSHGAERDSSQKAESPSNNTIAPGFSMLPDQESGWVLLPLGRPFAPIPSDPRDIKTGLRKNNYQQLEADVGSYRSIAGWKGLVKDKDTVLHMGIEGNGYFMMRKEESRFPLLSSDGLIGLYAEAHRNFGFYQFRYTHISAHLSDGLYDMREKIHYTRETLSLRVAKQLDFFRPYLGLHYLTHTMPKLPRLSWHIGFYSFLPTSWKNIRPFLGSDYRGKSQKEGSLLHFLGGLALISSQQAPPVRLSVSYMLGHDPRGQFYQERIKKWSFGLDLDL